MNTWKTLPLLDSIFCAQLYIVIFSSTDYLSPAREPQDAIVINFPNREKNYLQIFLMKIVDSLTKFEDKK